MFLLCFISFFSILLYIIGSKYTTYLIEEASIGSHFSKYDPLAATFVTQSVNGSVEVSNGGARGSLLVLDEKNDMQYRIKHTTSSTPTAISIVFGFNSPTSHEETQAGLKKSDDLFFAYICSCAGTNPTDHDAMDICLKYVREEGQKHLNERYVFFLCCIF